MSDKAVITCALNGVLTDPKQHNVPVTPEQMAREAKAAFNAGASIMHIHLRQQEPNKGHLPSWDVGVSKEIQQAIREACPGVIINHTTGTSGPNYQGALDCVRETKPEIAACNAGSLNYLKVKADNTWAWPPMMFDNAVEKVQDYLDVMKTAGTIPEFECFDVGIVRCVGMYRQTGMYSGPLEYNFVMGVASGMPADPELLPILLDRAQAQLEAAKARVVFTTSEVERGAQLVGNNIVTKRDFDQRDNANREAIANVKAAEAALQTAKLNLDYTEVRAPVDGRVGRIEVTVGNLVAAGTSSPVLTSLVSVNPIYASFDADEEVVLRALNSIADASGKRGNLDQIPVDMVTSGGLSAKGHIQLIDNQVNGQSGTIRVRAVFKNDDGRLIPGQFARVRMGQPKQQTLVLIDERAVGTDQDKKFVMLVGDDSRAVYRSVTLGGAVDGLRIVTAGLKSGDRIVVNGLQRVRPGALLKTEVAEMGARGMQQASTETNQHVVQR